MEHGARIRGAVDRCVGGAMTLQALTPTQTLPPVAPAVSIALLVKNGMPHVADLLRRLKSQVVDFPFEIVAVDSGSRDGSDHALLDAGARLHRIEPSEF